ncbi:MAG: hypothetical protein DWH96_04210 [Planctomycetota bacterium]|nr:MAG: hypothetical protein DWH96_04210 [Planctomycetota bacterium]
MSAINANAAAATAGNSSTPSRFNELSSEDFMRIIFTELSNQDPFKPSDSSALLEQLNSIRSIETDIQMQERLSSIVFQNQLSSAGNLIGKRVSGLNQDSIRVGGTVQSVIREGDSVGLVLNTGWVLPMDNVEFIDSPLPPATPAGNGSNTGGSTTGGTTGGGATGGSGGGG